ncbi:zinc finger protein 260 [Musca domestica]|uniref:Zinc finger protein 260 n=1 Tax=Musca domestica TaxID=7370 RepID=A0A9J7DH67_MUSDO|nr:zinc finger protein 260 [Musca domestica]
MSENKRIKTEPYFSDDSECTSYALQGQNIKIESEPYPYDVYQFVKPEEEASKNPEYTPPAIAIKQEPLEIISEPPPFLALKCIGCTETFNNDKLLRQHFLQQHARTNDHQQINLPKLEIIDVPELGRYKEEVLNNDEVVSQPFLHDVQQITLPKLEINDVPEKGEEGCEETFNNGEELNEIMGDHNKNPIDDDDDEDMMNMEEDEEEEDTDDAEDNESDSNGIRRKFREPPLIARLRSQPANWQPIMNCTECPETFTEYCLLSQHFTQAHLNRDFHIICCERKFSTQRHIEEHFSLHRDPNQFKCKKCGRYYTSREGVMTHMKRFHTSSVEKEFACKKCSQSFTTQRGLNLHDNVVHQTSVARPQPTVTVMENGQTIYGCKHCGYTCDSKRKFSNHWSHVHRQVPGYKCQKCGKVDRIDALRKHLRTHSTNLKCPACGKQCKRKNDLTCHITTKHSANKEEILKKLLETEEPLPEAINIIKTGDFICNYCNHVSDSVDALLLHIEESHKREHKCHLCNMAFRVRRGLICHLNRHKGDGNTKPNVAADDNDDVSQSNSPTTQTTLKENSSKPQQLHF